MTSFAHGRGKESFRRFSKRLNDEKRDIISAIKQGEDYTEADITRFLTFVTNEYLQELRANELDVELWGDRAIDYQLAVEEQIVNQFELEREKVDEEQSEKEWNGPIDNEDNDDGTLFGFPLVTKENKNEVRNNSVPRKRILLTLEELEEYIRGVPYIRYIQTIKNASGKVVGYRIWVDAAAQKRKRKKKGL